MSKNNINREDAGQLRLGNIIYSNCFPVHARLIDRPEPGDPEMVDGIPSRLNALLADGDIHVSPSSSIEFARHADQYRILPDLVIGARGAVQSIQFLSRPHPTDLDGAKVALPSASATSVVLLKILLRTRWRVRPEFFWFDQAKDDPFTMGASAALFIGDVALQPELYPTVPHRFDLGVEWFAQTGLPFAFAVWQANLADERMDHLHSLLLESRAYGLEHRVALAERHADRFGLEATMLADYWATLSYELDGEMREGLETYYRLAAEIGELPRAPVLRWL